MLEGTLTVSALDGDGVDPRLVPVRVDDVVRDAIAALPAMVELDVRGLEPVTAVVDRGHLVQVVTNLLTNAIKYGDGLVTATADEEDTTVFIRIRDHGSGVPDEFVPLLFERFTRSDGARDGTEKGTGLGLYITRSLLRANAGDVTYEHTPGGGATFCVQLPRAPRAAELLPA